MSLLRRKPLLGLPKRTLPTLSSTRLASTSSHHAHDAHGHHDHHHDDHHHGPDGDAIAPRGWKFGERPLPKGQKRVREGWERPYFWMIIFGGGYLLTAHYYKPDRTIQTWAKEEAYRRMEARGDLPTYDAIPMWPPIKKSEGLDGRGGEYKELKY